MRECSLTSVFVLNYAKCVLCQERARSRRNGRSQKYLPRVRRRGRSFFDYRKEADFGETFKKCAKKNKRRSGRVCRGFAGREIVVQLNRHLFVRRIRGVGFSAFPSVVMCAGAFVVRGRVRAGLRSREREFPFRKTDLQCRRVADKHQHEGEGKGNVPEERHERGGNGDYRDFFKSSASSSSKCVSLRSSDSRMQPLR